MTTTPTYDASAPLAGLEARAARADAVDTVPEWYLTAYAALRVTLELLVQRCARSDCDINTSYATELLRLESREDWEQHQDELDEMSGVTKRRRAQG